MTGVKISIRPSPTVNAVEANARFLVTGVLGPNGSSHGPNEFLGLKARERPTCSVAWVLERMARKGAAGSGASGWGRWWGSIHLSPACERDFGANPMPRGTRA